MEKHQIRPVIDSVVFLRDAKAGWSITGPQSHPAKS